MVNEFADIKNGIKDQVQNEQRESHKTIVNKTKRIECLRPIDCKKDRCCFTFLDPRSRCFKKCPRGWIERFSQQNTKTTKEVEYLTNNTTVATPLFPTGNSVDNFVLCIY